MPSLTRVCSYDDVWWRTKQLAWHAIPVKCTGEIVMTGILFRALDSIAAKGIDTNEWLTFSHAFISPGAEDKSDRHALTPWILLLPTLAHLASVESEPSFTQAARYCTRCYPLVRPTAANAALLALNAMVVLYDNTAFERNWTSLAQAISESVGTDPVYTGDFSCD